MTNHQETPICTCDAIKASLKQNGKGWALMLYINPDDLTDHLTKLPVGEVVKLYITLPDYGA